jgi:hypothetical protein
MIDLKNERSRKMNNIKTVFLVILAGIVVLTCRSKEKSEETLTIEQMERFEEELRDEIKTRKIDIVQMKEEIEKLATVQKENFKKEIDDMENRLLDVETKLDSLESIKDGRWSGFKSKIDSILDYVELDIDTTRLNIKQIIR